MATKHRGPKTTSPLASKPRFVLPPNQVDHPNGSTQPACDPAVEYHAVALRDHTVASLRMIGLDKPQLVELFDYIEDLMFWIKDLRGRFVWVNLPLLVNFGLQDRSQIIGRTDYDIADANLVTQYREYDAEVLKHGAIRSHMELVGQHNHTSQWYTTSKIPLLNRMGVMVGTAGVTMRCRPQDLARRVPVLGKAIEYIAKRYGESISNRTLANLCGCSLRVFYRKFWEMYGMTPVTYIRRYRVRESCHALVYSSKTMAEIAQQYGFSDQSHYSREFRRIMKEVPSHYRSRFKKSLRHHGG